MNYTKNYIDNYVRINPAYTKKNDIVAIGKSRYTVITAPDIYGTVRISNNRTKKEKEVNLIADDLEVYRDRTANIPLAAISAEATTTLSYKVTYRR